MVRGGFESYELIPWKQVARKPRNIALARSDDGLAHFDEGGKRRAAYL